MKPFDLEVLFGDRVAVLGSNGSGKSHFLRLLAARRLRSRHRAPAGRRRWHRPGAHTGTAKLGARVRPGWFAQTHAHPELLGRDAAGDPAPRRRPPRRDGPRAGGSRRSTATGWPQAAEQTFESLSGGQQARLQILLLELSGATLLLLDEPTDNLDLHSAEALEDGAGRLRGHGRRRHPRPLVRPRLRPLPGLRRRRRGLRVRRAGLGRGARPARALTNGSGQADYLEGCPPARP